jgi:predicted secreted protein
MSERDDLRREAVLHAEMVIADLDLEPGDRVPVFELIEDRGIWLSFDPMEELLGVYQRIGDTAGTSINSARPLTLQRFTAAHELGHHELGHTSSLDDAATIERSFSSDPRELQAQTFAASLLMSELWVEARLEHRGHDTTHPALDALDVYVLSAELGVSFTAAVTQLRTLHKLSQTTADQLYRIRPLALKQQLLGGRKPDNARASVWQLTLADNQRRISVDVGDELDVALPEIPSSGYEWTVSDATKEWFSIVGDRYAGPQSDAPLFGGGGERHFTVKVVRAGLSPLRFCLEQPWDGGDQSTSYTVDVVSTAMPTSEVGRGISVHQQPQLLDAA